jgi:hypothetical protein
MIPLRDVSLPIAADWKCQRSGDCCTTPASVVMSTHEAALILQRLEPLPGPPTLRFTRHSDGFVALEAKPCPMFVNSGCLVYDIRPYNCRRFACMRPDPATEPFVIIEDQCVNFTERFLRSRIVRRLARKIQSRAQVWARAHGWGASLSRDGWDQRTPSPLTGSSQEASHAS